MWIDGTGQNVRLKDRVLKKIPERPEDCPEWQYDGSSTYQAQGGNSDVQLVPRALYKDPFKAGPNDVIVLCDTYKPDGSPCDSNFRNAMQAAYDQTKNLEPWFGIEQVKTINLDFIFLEVNFYTSQGHTCKSFLQQEYTFLDVDGRPLGWPSNGFPGPQGPYYCAAGAEKVVGRDIVEAHALACLYAGIEFAGTNAEVMPAQWEYQVGPCLGMKAADDLWISRYILWRIAEEYGVVVTFDPKPMEGNWNGAGKFKSFILRSKSKFCIQQVATQISLQSQCVKKAALSLSRRPLRSLQSNIPSTSKHTIQAVERTTKDVSVVV